MVSSRIQEYSYGLVVQCRLRSVSDGHVREGEGGDCPSSNNETPGEHVAGVDNRAAGRLAGDLIGRFLPKDEPQKIALFAGSLAYRGHEEREMGFRHILSEEFRYLEIVDRREIRDDRIRAYAESTTLLSGHPDLAAIYNIGGGNSGIGKPLEECGRGREVVFVGHEVTEDTRLMLIKGTMDALTSPLSFIPF